jgi:hypothetical protein
LETEANRRDAKRSRRAEEERGAGANARGKAHRDKAEAGASKRRADLILMLVAAYHVL